MTIRLDALIHKPFFDIPDTSGGSGLSQTADSIFGFLSQDDDKDKPETKSDAKDDDKDENDKKLKLDLPDDDDEDDEDDDQDEDEDSDDDSDEDKEELDELKVSEDEDEAVLAKIPTRAEIKAKYPNIFKEFKALDHIFYRERAYSEVYPTVKDAQDSVELVKQFNGFQNELFSGNIEGTLKAVKAADPKAFDKITNNLLDSLVRIDPNSHLGITTQISKGILNQIHLLAGQNLKRDPNNKQAQQLQIAAEMIHEALFNTPEVTPYAAAKQQDKEDPEKQKLKTEREEFDKTRFTAAFGTVSNKVQSLLTKAVERDIDTKNILTPYVKNKVVNDIMVELDRQLSGDNRFKSLVAKLWDKARESGYSDTSLNNIQNALKEKARTILPGIMRAKKGEALKGLASGSIKNKERDLSRKINRERTPNKDLTRSRVSDDKDKPRDGESNLDYLNRVMG